MKLPKLNVLLIPDVDHWSAVGLECFLVAQAKNPLSAVRELRLLYELQPCLYEEKEQYFLALIPKAPEPYWKMFQEAQASLVLRGGPHFFSGEFRISC
jgi:hypothetical protein